MADIGKEIGTALLGLGQGVNNYVSMQDKMLEHEQRAEKLRKEKELEEFTDSSVGAMKALYGVESMMGNPAFQGDVTGQAKGFLDFYNKDVPNGRTYTGASIARGQDGKAVLMLTETDDQGNTRQVPADTRKLIRNTALTYSMKTGKALHDDADKYEQQLKMERLRQDNRMDVLQAKVDAQGSRVPNRALEVEDLVKRGVHQDEAVRRVYGHDPASPKDSTAQQYTRVWTDVYNKNLLTEGEERATELANKAAEAFMSRFGKGQPAPGAAPQVVQAPAPAPAAAPPLARSHAPVQSSPPPGAPAAQTAPTGAGGDPHDAISAAMRAIQSGKDPAAVKARLKQMTGLPDEYINTYIP